jgi:hypothetical protein
MKQFTELRKEADIQEYGSFTPMRDKFGPVNPKLKDKNAPKMKDLSLYGSEVSGLRAKDGKLYSAKPVVSGGKLAYKVMDEFGSFDTLPLKKFAAKFG